jgi:hypothetical protein
MKNFTVTTTSAPDISDGALTSQMSMLFYTNWHLVYNGSPHPMRSFCIFRMGQTAAGCKSHPKNIPRTELTYELGGPMAI